MIRILHLLEEEYPNRPGGVERYFYFLFNDSKSDKSHSNISVTAKQFGLQQPYSLRSQSIGYPKIIEERVLDWIHSQKIDLIHVHHPAPYGLALIQRLANYYPLIIHWHDHFLLCQKTQLYPYQNKRCSGPNTVKCASCLQASRYTWKFIPTMALLTIRFWRTAAIFRSCSTIILPQKSLMNKVPRSFRNKCVVIPYESHALWEADLGLVSQSSICRENFTGSWVVAGNVNEHKGIQDLINQLDQSRFSGQLNLFGEGWNEVDDLPKFVKLRGKLISKNQLKNCTHWIIPSKWEETGPLVAIEAYQLGLQIWAKKGAVSHEFSRKFEISIYEDAKEIQNNKPTATNIYTPQWNTLREKYTNLYNKIFNLMKDNKKYADPY